jgi:hypothetical protein
MHLVVFPAEDDVEFGLAYALERKIFCRLGAEGGHPGVVGDGRGDADGSLSPEILCTLKNEWVVHWLLGKRGLVYPLVEWCVIAIAQADNLHPYLRTGRW